MKYSTGTLTIGNVEIFNLLISKLDIPKRWKLRLTRHFWREDYFSDLLKRLETNSDVDPTIVEVDKRRYLKMLEDNQSSIVAGRTLKEILERGYVGKGSLLVKKLGKNKFLLSSKPYTSINTSGKARFIKYKSKIRVGIL